MRQLDCDVTMVSFSTETAVRQSALRAGIQKRVWISKHMLAGDFNVELV